MTDDKLPPIQTPAICVETKDLYNFVYPNRYLKSLCVVNLFGNYYDASIMCQKNRMKLFKINNEFTEAALYDTLKNSYKISNDGNNAYWIQGKVNKLCASMSNGQGQSIWETSLETCSEKFSYFCEFLNTQAH